MNVETRKTRISSPLNGWGRVLIATLVALAVAVSAAPAASADSTYYPSSWNGKTIYLSKACHDGNDGIPGGACIENTGCKSFGENDNSLATARSATYGGTGGTNLVGRGYKVIIGNGTVDANIANSNAKEASLHVPIHSNAHSTTWCSLEWSDYGTLVMYVSTKGNDCAKSFVDRIGPVSPGTWDRRKYVSNLRELNATTAVACYLETEYHTWNKGVDFLVDRDPWTWRIGYAVDVYLGYPR